MKTEFLIVDPSGPVGWRPGCRVAVGKRSKFASLGIPAQVNVEPFLSFVHKRDDGSLFISWGRFTPDSGVVCRNCEENQKVASERGPKGDQSIGVGFCDEVASDERSCGH